MIIYGLWTSLWHCVCCINNRLIFLPWGVRGCQRSRKKALNYEGVRFNVIKVTRGWVGVKFPGKERYVTLEWPHSGQRVCNWYIDYIYYRYICWSMYSLVICFCSSNLCYAFRLTWYWPAALNDWRMYCCFHNYYNISDISLQLSITVCVFYLMVPLTKTTEIFLCELLLCQVSLNFIFWRRYQYKRARSLSITDRQLLDVCKGLWTKLRYLYERRNGSNASQRLQKNNRKES